MAKVKYDVSGSDPEGAMSLQRTSPRPGMYVGRLAELNLGHSRDENGKPDKGRPRMEVITKMLKADKPGNKKYTGSQVWDYLLLPGHEGFTGFPEQKLDNFLQSLGIAKKKSKRKGTFDTDDLKGKKLLVIIRADKDQDGNYRGRVGQYLPYDPDTFKESASRADEDEEDFDAEAIEDEELEGEEPDEDEDEEDEEEDEDEEEEEDEDEDEDEEEEEDEDEEEGFAEDEDEEEEEEEEEPPKKKKAKKSKVTKKATSKKSSAKKSKKASSKKRKKKSEDDEDEFPFD
jgi:hypothetical protein